ncbi:hypothetical protein [Hyphomicrobium sulfonivorans]|uniref:hypothetical protein n=1 Tax=Hyphomicrobium sulfonivorans TaxID=121290 RepID=UPI000838680A|nr:hypothetical protein [Hyphomicrobium sulfonivorans]
MNYFHTDMRPPDSTGAPLKPLDIVILGEIPEHYWVDSEDQSLRNYAGCYGLVTYRGEGPVFDPYYIENHGHPGWVSEDGRVVNVLSRRLCDNAICSAEFWMPPANLQKIPYNSLIVDLFAQYPWEMNDTTGPSSRLFITNKVQEFAYLKRILETPLDRLQRAHAAAVAVLDE